MIRYALAPVIAFVALQAAPQDVKLSIERPVVRAEGWNRTKQAPAKVTLEGLVLLKGTFTWDMVAKGQLDFSFRRGGEVVEVADAKVATDDGRTRHPEATEVASNPWGTGSEIKPPYTAAIRVKATLPAPLPGDGWALRVVLEGKDGKVVAESLEPILQERR